MCFLYAQKMDMYISSITVSTVRNHGEGTMAREVGIKKGVGWE